MDMNVFATQLIAVLRTEPPATTWWAGWIPWIALGFFVASAALTVAFFPLLLRGGLGKFGMVKALIAGGLPAERAASAPDSPQPGGAPAGSPEAGDTDDGPAPQAPTWEGLDLSIFDEGAPSSAG
jgi:hypothetical protein